MREIKKGKLYKHFKGNLYQVLDIVNDCESKNNEHLDKIVIYKALYGENLTWARSYDMFNSEVDHEKYPEIVQKYRFEEYLSVNKKESKKALLLANSNISNNIIETFAKVNIQITIENKFLSKDETTNGLVSEHVFSKMNSIDLLVIEYSEKSLDLGIGAGYCYANNVPVYIIAKAESEITPMIKTIAEKIIFYNSMEDINKQFKNLINNNQLKTR